MTNHTLPGGSHSPRPWETLSRKGASVYIISDTLTFILHHLCDRLTSIYTICVTYSHLSHTIREAGCHPSTSPTT